MPPIPGNEVTAQARPKARTLELTLPPTELAAAPVADENQMVPRQAGEESSTSSDIGIEPAGRPEIEVRLKALELQFRTAFQDALHRPSRKPSQFGGLAGYHQLQSLVTTLQFQLPQNDTGPVRTLLEQGQRTLQETAELAEDVRRAQGYLQQITHLLAAPLKTEQPANQLTKPPHPYAVEPELSQGQQIKQKLKATLTTLANHSRAGSVTQSFLTNTERLLAKWEDNLFHCYDIPGLPASNTALEARFSDLRRSQRRVSGHKETSALRRTAHFQILCGLRV